MKTISLKTHPTLKIRQTEDSAEEPMTTKILLEAVVNQMPASGGITVEDMEVRLKLRKLIADVNPESTVLELEDADWKHLKDKLLPGMQWRIIDDFIPDFVNSIKTA